MVLSYLLHLSKKLEYTETMIKNLWRGMLPVSIEILEYFNDVKLDSVFTINSNFRVLCIHQISLSIFLMITFKNPIKYILQVVAAVAT